MTFIVFLIFLVLADIDARLAGIQKLLAMRR
jgi:hypothetical protein